MSNEVGIELKSSDTLICMVILDVQYIYGDQQQRINHLKINILQQHFALIQIVLPHFIKH